MLFINKIFFIVFSLFHSLKIQKVITNEHPNHHDPGHDQEGYDLWIQR